MWVRSLDHRDTLEKEMATHANLLVWEIPWKEEPDGQQTFSEEAHKTVFKILDQKRNKKVRCLLKSRKAADIHKENMVIGGRFFYSSIEDTVVTS